MTTLRTLRGAPFTFAKGRPRRLAAWLRKVPTDASGVYWIRVDGTLRYVGESHTGALRRTLLRHFQKWSGDTAGPTYPPRTSTVVVVVCKPEKAVAIQNSAIEDDKPTDNVVGVVMDDSVEDTPPMSDNPSIALLRRRRRERSLGYLSDLADAVPF